MQMSERTMKKAIWFSRHHPTEPQIQGIKNLGYELIRIPEIERLSVPNYSTREQWQFVFRVISYFCDINNIEAIFGVFAVPFQNRITADAATFWKDHIHEGEIETLVDCYGAWNVDRPSEDGKRTFCHKSWDWVGCICVTDAIRYNLNPISEYIDEFVSKVNGGVA